MTGGTDYDMLTISDHTIKVRQKADEAQAAASKMEKFSAVYTALFYEVKQKDH